MSIFSATRARSGRLAAGRASLLASVLTFGLALLATGCAAPLIVQRLAHDEIPPPGLVYPLAFTRFDITVTRTMVGCDADGATVETKVEGGAGHAAPDPARTYLVRPGPGLAWWQADARVAYAASGAAKGFNASMEDRSAQAASALVTVLRRFGWLGALAGAARAPDCAIAGRAAPRQVARFHWPPDGDTFEGEPPAPLGSAWPAAIHIPPVHFRLVAGDGQPFRGRDEPAPQALPGVPYRLPVAARLQACEGPCEGALPLFDAEVSIVQGGPVYVLPCEASAFSASRCVLAMDAAGGATAAGFGQSRAPAEGAAAAGKDILR